MAQALVKTSLGDPFTIHRHEIRKMNNDNWIKPEGSPDPSTFDGMTVIIRTKIRTEATGTIHLRGQNDEGQIQLLVSYDESPFPDLKRNKTFYLTQDQLIEYQFKGPKCVIVPPETSN